MLRSVVAGLEPGSADQLCPSALTEQDGTGFVARAHRQLCADQTQRARRALLTEDARWHRLRVRSLGIGRVASQKSQPSLAHRDDGRALYPFP